MNLNTIYKELADLQVGNIDAAALNRTQTDLASLVTLVRAAEAATRALVNVANNTPDDAIKELLAAELGLRNHALFAKTSTEPKSLLNTVIQKRRLIELKVHDETLKKSQRRSDLGSFSKQEKSRKTRIEQEETIARDDFNPTNFEDVSEADAALTWQMKSKLRDEKRKRREARAEVLKEMQDRLRNKSTASPIMEDEDAASPAALFEQIKRQLRFVPKKSHAWACVLLGIPPDSTLDFAKSKFRERARLWHPDMSEANEKPIMTEAMAWLNEAWKIFRQSK